VTNMHRFLWDRTEAQRRPTWGCFVIIIIIMTPSPMRGHSAMMRVWCLSDDVCCVHRACAADRPAGWDGTYWLIGPGWAGLAQGCRFAFLLQGAWHIVAASRTACYYYYYYYYY